MRSKVENLRQADLYSMLIFSFFSQTDFLNLHSFKYVNPSDPQTGLNSSLHFGHKQDGSKVVEFITHIDPWSQDILLHMELSSVNWKKAENLFRILYNTYHKHQQSRRLCPSGVCKLLVWARIQNHMYYHQIHKRVLEPVDMEQDICKLQSRTDQCHILDTLNIWAIHMDLIHDQIHIDHCIKCVSFFALCKLQHEVRTRLCRFYHQIHKLV